MTGAAARLLLVVALLALIAGIQVFRADTGTPVALAAGALLLAGLFAGKLVSGFGLPKLTGYLLIGILIGPYAIGFIPEDGVYGLELIKGLAVSLIALTAGAELHLSLLRRVGGRVIGLCGAVVGLVFLGAWVAILIARPWLAMLSGMNTPQVLAVAALLASVVVSFSPTVTIAIVQETRAKGPFTEFLMTLVIVGDVFVLILFALAAAATRASFGGGLDLSSLAVDIGWELFGSLLVGAVVGLFATIYLQRVSRDVAVFIVALCFASAEAGAHLHLSPLLLSLAAGAAISNLDPPRAEKLQEATAAAAVPVFALFFAASGAGLHIGAVVEVGPIALLLVFVRGAAIYGSCRWMAPSDPPRLKRYLWMGLISQAGVTFGLAALVRRTFPSFGVAAEVLIIAMVTMHELIGPLLVRRGLMRSGEIQQT